MIEAKNITKSFRDKAVLKDVSTVFMPGKTNLIIGQSGSGKTVLMKCLIGLFTPDSGTISYDGRTISSLSFDEMKDIRQEIGMLFQGGALFDSQTVEENIMFPLTMFTQMSLEEKRDRANFCLRRVNLENVNKLYPSEISGGMKKRVAIARALVMEPQLLLYDEPTSELDPVMSATLTEIIATLREQTAVTSVVVTHDRDLAFSIADRIAFVMDGRIRGVGKPADFKNPTDPVIANFLNPVIDLKNPRFKQLE
jgi:phospholipid/cholesterol/gamma-HCH transport system ATP-binding protein